MNNHDLANLIFPEIKETISDLEKRYPARNLTKGEYVSRFAPSPTGYLHTGSLFTAMIASKVAAQTKGIFYVRLEDTDTKRTIEGAANQLIEELARFNIKPNEGYLGDKEIGAYGPYKQSERRNIYKIVLKHMIEQGLAYPCFCSENELQELRLVQEQNKAMTGYYGEYAICRHLSADQAIQKIKEGKPYVLRFRSPGNHKNKTDVYDLIRGKINIAENDVDIVIYKSDGLPTYHLAHAVDDHFMRTNIVVRGEEWISSLPLHFQLFSQLGWEPPKYAHLPVIMKIDETSKTKRKLSKRHDQEAAVSFFLEQGYPPEAIIIYLMTIANSNFEEWLIQNGLRNYQNFEFTFEKVSLEGALFDMQKLIFYAKEYLASLKASQIAMNALEYGKEYDSNLVKAYNSNPEYFLKIMNVEREQEKPRKDYAKYSDILPAIRFYNCGGIGYSYEEAIKMYDELQKFPHDVIKKVLNAVKDSIPYGVCEQEWFQALSQIGVSIGFAPDTKTYKGNPSEFLGSPGDVAEILRIALTMSTRSPNLSQVMNVLGKKEVDLRLEKLIKLL